MLNINDILSEIAADAGLVQISEVHNINIVVGNNAPPTFEQPVEITVVIS